ncbi:MIP/aquaporin family protein [Nocardiopsis ansamitocini]|uniref:Glycerol transporter n=1 Tax=Nocardiopsis ansamitocini TaxID=1670832 RepID=A0A9W6P5J6_9ACTN|nr:MIP/aquaporin family protein [Nocardiopsis ansamitocini]GLU47595.1 glycerol transporter [Nocardiopsis ansamitocini]
MVTTATIFVGEFFGTAILVLFGCGVVAGVTLSRSKSQNAGWVAIAFGWGLGVMSGAYIALPLSGAHLNPAVTLGLALDTGEWAKVPVYIVAQILGAIVGAALVWLTYLGQFGNTEGPYLGIFSTAPEVRNPAQNMVTEIIATFALVFVIVATGQNEGLTLSGTGVLIVALLVVGIGLSLGGPTGYAINPARDLGPRLAHAFLPIRGKGGSDWGYSWIPIAGPVVGGLLGGGVGSAVYSMI